MTRIFPLFATVMLAACQGDSDTPGKDDPVTPSSPQAVTGRAESPASGDRSGTVRAWRLDADGSVVAASEADGTIEDGRYTLDLDGEESSALVVEASFDDGSSASVLVVSGSDAVLTAAPMSAETSGEAGIYLTMADLGVDDADETGSVLRAFVTADVAAGWSDTDADADASLSLGVGAAVQAWEASGGSASDAAIEAVVAATVQADAEADSSGEAQAQADVTASLVAAWEDAGSTTDDLSFMAAAALEAQLAVAGDSDGDDAASDFLSDVRVEFATDVILDAIAVIDEEDGNDLSLDVNAVVAATIDGDLGGLLAQLGVSLSAAQMAEMADEAEFAASAGAAVEAAVDAAEDTETGAVAASAVADFREAIEVDVAANLAASGEFDDAQASAVATLLAQLYVVG